VIEAARWRQEHPDPSEQALGDALSAFDWDPSVKSLVTVPQVLQYMTDSPRWMQALGRAVLDDRQHVMASVQALRQKALDTGTLASNDKHTVNVDTDASNGIEYVSITPASPKVVYVPVYDPYVVYGSWWWPSRPVYWGPPVGAAYSGGFYWSPYYYYPPLVFWGGFNWGRGMITFNAPHRSHHYRHHHRTSPRGSNVWRQRSPSGGGHSRPHNRSHSRHRR
jgi:hypothetical protein